MQVNNVNSAINQMVTPFVPLSPPTDTSLAKLPSPTPKSPQTAQPLSTAANGSSANNLLFGSVGLDLFYSRSESLVRDYRTEGPDGYRQVHQEMSRRYEAGLSLDFSFLAQFEGAAEKLRNVDRSVFADWAKEASDLISLSDKDFEEFVSATDELFNEIEKVLGMGSTGLDNVASFFGGQVKGFLDDVKANKAYFDQNPLGEGEDGGLGIPALLDAAKSAIPDNFKKYVDDLFKQSDNSTTDDSDKPMAGTLKELLSRILENLRKAELDLLKNPEQVSEKRTDDAPLPDKTTGSTPEEKSAQPSNESERRMQELRVSYHYQKQMTISALIAYNQPTEEKPPASVNSPIAA